MATLFAARAGSYCGIALLVGIIGVAALMALALSMFRAIGSGPSDPAELWTSMSAVQKLGSIFGLLLAVWMPIFLAARGVCQITVASLAGRAMTLDKVLADVVRFIPSALVYSFVIGIATMVGSFMLGVPGLLVLSLSALVVPASTGGASDIFAGLRQGVSLSPKVFGKAFLLVLASSLVIMAAVVLRILALDSLVSGPTAMVFAFRLAVVYVPAMLMLILTNICFTLLYMDARRAAAPVSL
jgi:hypothetical protein